MDKDLPLFQNSIKYLHNISVLPEMNNPTLKSFICLKRRLMELRKSSFLPYNSTKPHIHCQRCFLNFYDGPTTYRIKSKLKKPKFAKKVMKKEKNGLYLTKYQQEYIKRRNAFNGNQRVYYNKHEFNGNQLVITCSFCKNEMDVKLPKPVKEIKNNNNNNNNNNNQNKLKEKPKKKKSKKDIFCGLDKTAVANVSATKSINNRNQPKKIIKNLNEYQNHSNNIQITCVDNLPKKKSKFQNSSIICLDSDDETPRKSPKYKYVKKAKPVETSTPKPVAKLSALDLKKKNKLKGKLSEILKTPKKKSSSNLLQFLQGL